MGMYAIFFQSPWHMETNGYDPNRPDYPQEDQEAQECPLTGKN